MLIRGKGLSLPFAPLQAPLAGLLSRSDLVVTRRIEWGSVLIGFEQARQADKRTGG